MSFEFKCTVCSRDSVGRDSRVKFCSPECNKIYRKEYHKIRQRNGRAPIQNCGWCKADISSRRLGAKFCSKICYDKKDNIVNRTRRRKANYKYYKINKEECDRKALLFARNNPLRRKEINREYYQRNLIRERLRGKLKAATRRVQSLNQGAFTVTSKDILKLINRFNGKCAYCGVREYEHIDHVVPIIRGGRQSLGNLLPSCERCNLSKGKKLLFQWKIWRLTEPHWSD